MTGDGRRSRGLSFDGMAIGLLFVALAFAALMMPAQSDTFWQLRDGLEILMTGQIPRRDHYSYTAATAPYVDHEWLSEIWMALAHRAGGMPGVTLLAAAAVMGALVLAYRLTVGPRLARFAILAPALVLSSCVWVLRPQVFTLLAVAATAWLLARDRWRWLPPLFWVWANAHGGVVVGWVMLAAAAVAAVARWRCVGAEADRRRVGALALVLPLTGLATLATPLGRHIFRYVAETAARGAATQISEWFPPRPTDPLGAAFWLIALGFWAVVVVRWRPVFGRQSPSAPDGGDGAPEPRTAGGAWSDWVLVAVAAALFPVAARSLRNISPFLLLAGPAASRLLLGAKLGLPGRSAAASPDHPLVNLALLAVAASVAAAVVAAAWITELPRLGWHPIAASTVEAVRSCPARLYNQYDAGGELIWFVPERRVFIDNRQDPYPLPFLLEDAAVERGAAPYRPLFDLWNIRCAFVDADSLLARRLAADGWTPRARDARWAVLVAP